MAERTGNVIDFTRRPINEWPKSVYLADLGDGCRPYSYIQRPDDTTPEYVRYDLHFAAVIERDRLVRQIQTGPCPHRSFPASHPKFDRTTPCPSISATMKSCNALATRRQSMTSSGGLQNVPCGVVTQMSAPTRP